ncbi:hypothetical protein EON64_13960, partial [archaeon]
MVSLFASKRSMDAVHDKCWHTHTHNHTHTHTRAHIGVVNVTQCPISNVPGFNSFVYTFRPDLPGTYWYHGHMHSHYPDGESCGRCVRMVYGVWWCMGFVCVACFYRTHTVLCCIGLYGVFVVQDVWERDQWAERFNLSYQLDGALPVNSQYVLDLERECDWKGGKGDADGTGDVHGGGTRNGGVSGIGGHGNSG